MGRHRGGRLYTADEYVMIGWSTGACDYEVQPTHLGQVLSAVP